ncbi:uncharacterized protein LOC114299378 [Camellia sinensis]|uniref:uncharacterized protein LOC114299378 n=1 Tax=Camellia sinensis TaxID=4442 RepID=UPI001036533D|nr:uncharacterized protein LOC114299378 [Camellia sinensis]
MFSSISKLSLPSTSTISYCTNRSIDLFSNDAPTNAFPSNGSLAIPDALVLPIDSILLPSSESTDITHSSESPPFSSSDSLEAPFVVPLSKRQVIEDELQALHKTHTWDMVALLPRKTPIGCKWVHKIKTHSDGTIECYKACFVAESFTEEYDVDYEETFVPIAHLISVRGSLVVATSSSGVYLRWMSRILFSLL